MQNQESLQEEVAQLGANPQLWAGTPVLDEVSGQNYLGRVLIETFENEHSHLITNEPSLFEIALLALETKKYTSKRVSNITLEPASGPNNEDLFIGHVIFEVWTNQINLGITGSPEQNAYLLDQATKTLKSFSS